MTRQDNRLWSPWQPDSSPVCLAFFHLKMKPEAKKSWKCNQQINWYRKKGEEEKKERRKIGPKSQVRLQAIKWQHPVLSIPSHSLTHQLEILKQPLINMKEKKMCFFSFPRKASFLFKNLGFCFCFCFCYKAVNSIKYDSSLSFMCWFVLEFLNSSPCSVPWILQRP